MLCAQVSFVLSSMVSKLQETPSVRLLKHIVRCYLRLSEHQR
jgi:CCR4-NOT transcription complex subunit 9